MATMTHRERVLTALQHKETDRVPVDLGSTRNTGILLAPYAELELFLGSGGGGTAPHDGDSAAHGISKVLGLATPTEVVLERLGIDFRGIYMGKADVRPRPVAGRGRRRVVSP